MSRQQKIVHVYMSQCRDNTQKHITKYFCIFIHRATSDDEEMDIKFVNPNLVSPRKTPIHVVKPALKSSMQSLRSTPGGVRRDSAVKFSKDVIHMRSSSSLDQRWAKSSLCPPESV